MFNKYIFAISLSFIFFYFPNLIVWKWYKISENYMPGSSASGAKTLGLIFETSKEFPKFVVNIP